MSENEELPLTFGVHATTGKTLELKPGTEFISQMLTQEKTLRQAIGTEILPGMNVWGVPYDVNHQDLSEAGWGIIFAADVDPQPWLDALEPLIMQRRIEASDRFRLFSGSNGYRKGESASAWLNRHGAALLMIDPAQGVPYYLTIVGPPTQVPFSFQYSLDIVAAVGRIDFQSITEYQSYASSVVNWERDASRYTRRSIDLFATCHNFDRATQLFTNKVASPFASGTEKYPPLGEKYGYQINALMGANATKDKLKQSMCNAFGAPSLIFTGSHGMAFNADDPRQLHCQGAIVCQDWPGLGEIDERHWFSADDVPEQAVLHGAIHFFFACYSAGTPQFDDFNFESPSRAIAPEAMSARLPQKLMSLPQGGVLATLGHIDRAWSSSFQTPEGVAQTQGFKDVISQLLAGQRVGQAVDRFNSQWGVWSSELVTALLKIDSGMAISDAQILSLRTQRDDCRNYIVLGDPAVRLKPEPAYIALPSQV
ncbi:hypothetical protein WDR79_001962 [Citrobacter freundii]